MKPTKLPVPRPTLSRSLKTLLDTSHRESRVLGEVQRLLLERQHKGDGRPNDVLHPSEICKTDWCQRAGYFQLIGVRHKNSEYSSWRRQMIFDEGHTIHNKWQNWLWDLGILKGDFFCFHCQTSSTTQAPMFCEKCQAPRPFLKYHEVPLVNLLLRIGGHADGEIDGAIIEIKSIGLRTLPFENPKLLEAHTYKFNINGKQREFIDLDGLWNGINHPFPSHLRQADIYVFLRNDPTIREVVFIYECKWNQAVKEFVVKYSEDRIRSILDSCHAIRNALQTKQPPPCSHNPDGCPECLVYEGTEIDSGKTNNKRLPPTIRESPAVRPQRTFVKR